MLYPLCRHIHTNGTQCDSPALTNETHCFYHTRLYQKHRRSSMPRSKTADGTPPEPMQLGLLDDAESIQVAISQIVNALATGQLEPRLATALLYGLQMASNNLARIPSFLQREVVRSVDTTPDGHGLAKDPTFYNDGKSQPK